VARREGDDQPKHVALLDFLERGGERLVEILRAVAALAGVFGILDAGMVNSVKSIRLSLALRAFRMRWAAEGQLELAAFFIRQAS
jgi:hypothetical protein